MRRRLFVAADVDETTRAACAAVTERLRAAGWTAKWVAPENYHITLAFLGGVDGERVEEIAAAVRAACGGTPAFDMPLDAVGAFPNARRPRVAWAGPASAQPAFAALCDAVRGRLGLLGFTFDHPGEPHVTLARADGRAALPPAEPPQTPPLRLDALTLFESFTERTGVRYVPLERFALASG